MYVLTGRLPKRPWNDLPHTQDVRARCESLLGHDLTGQLMTALQSDEDLYLEALIPQIRRAAAWRGIVHHPINALGLIRAWFARQLRPHRTGIAPIVALVGPEDVDKASIMNALSEQIPAPFLGLKCRRWRPGIVRKTAGRFHALRLFWYWCHYTLARYIHDNKDSSALRVVCYDGHPVDMMIDPIRYGLSSKWGTRWLCRIFPKPDLLILVYKDLAKSHERKDEPLAEEHQARVRDWLKLAKRGDTDTIVRVDAQTGDGAGRILALIMDKFIEKYGVFVATRPLRWTGAALSTTPADPDDPLSSIGCSVD